MNDMPITAIAPWAGGKRLLARWILETCGPHDAWWEPFGGGLGLVLAKEPCRLEVVNDLHEDLTNLARVIADPKLGPELYRRLRRVLFCQGLHSEAQERLSLATDPLERAYYYFIKVWMGWGGAAGTTRAGRKMSVRFTNKGGNQATRFFSAVQSITAWRRRLRGVTILNRDAFKLIGAIEDAAGTVIYVDPPYLDNKVDYEFSFTLEDHHRLAEALGRFRHTRVVVSSYEHPLLAALYPGWHRRYREVNKLLMPFGKRGPHRESATEVLLVNQSLGLF